MSVGKAKARIRIEKAMCQKRIEKYNDRKGTDFI